MDASSIKILPMPASNKAPPNSVGEWPILYTRTEEPKRAQAPHSIFGIPLKSVDLPLKEKKDGPKNDANTPKYHVDGCSRSTIMGMYNPPKGLVSGSVYIASGATYTEYLAEDGKYTDPLRSINLTDLTLSKKSTLEHIRELSFQQKCIKPHMYPGDPNYSAEVKYQFFAAEIDYRYPRQPNTLAGAFTMPREKETKNFVYEDVEKKQSDAFTGGNAPAQCVLNQTDANGIIQSFMIYTRLYSASIDKFQFRQNNWRNLGFYMMHHQQGVMTCLVTNGAAKIDPEYESKFTAGMEVNATFIPDLPAMIQSTGFEIDWATVTKLVPTMPQNGDNLKCEPTETPIRDMRGMRAVNLMRINGDVTAMIEMPEWVKFYLVFDYRLRMDKDGKIIPPPAFKSPEERVTWVLNPDNWNTGYMTFEIYAVCTPECPENIDKFISEPKQLAAIRAVKRPRLAEPEPAPAVAETTTTSAPEPAVDAAAPVTENAV